MASAGSASVLGAVMSTPPPSARLATPVSATGVRPAMTPGSAGRRKKKKPKEGCSVGMDRDRRFVCRSGEKEFRVPRVVVPLALVVLLAIVFVRRGTAGDHIARAEQQRAYAGSLDGAVLTVLAYAGATLGGVPPGALFVPIFIAVEGLSPHDAIPLSLATTLGGAAAAVLRDLTKPHPLRPHRKLLDFHTAALLAPPVAAGTVAGVYVNKILPPWMLTLLLTATLLFFTVKAAREGREILAPADPLAAAAGVAAGAADVEAPPATVGGTPLDSLVADEANDTAARQRLLAAGGTLLGFAVLQAVAPCGGMLFYAALLAVFFSLAGVGLWHAQQTVATHAARVQAGFVYAPGDIEWDESKAANGASKGLAGGVATGALGLGTGPTVVPTASLMGLLPAVSAPTTAAITALAAFAGCMHFAVVGLLGFIALWQAVLGFCGVSCPPCQPPCAYLDWGCDA